MKVLRLEQNKFLTEAINECWHNFISEVGKEYTSSENNSLIGCDWKVFCSKCGLVYRQGYKELSKKVAARVAEGFVEHANTIGRQNGTFYFIDFSTPEGFFKLLDWAKEQSWWEQFLIKHCQASHYTHIAIDIKYVNPDRFASAIYEYLKEN
jgi:hypothetical protein